MERAEGIIIVLTYFTQPSYAVAEGRAAFNNSHSSRDYVVVVAAGPRNTTATATTTTTTASVLPGHLKKAWAL